MTDTRSTRFAPLILPVIAIFVGALPIGCTGSARPDPFPGTDRVARIVTSLLDVARLPGFSVAVLQGDSVVYRAAFGMADLEAGTPATANTRYPMASVSKMFTVTALAHLVQNHRIDLDVPASRYVSDFSGTEGFTTRQLAGHLAGLGHYQPTDRIEHYRVYHSVTEALDVFRASPRIGPPGAQYRYSTHGYTLLSAVIESAADTTFLAYVDQAVLQPLGLDATGPRSPGEPPPQEAAAVYIRSGDRPARVQRPAEKSYSWAGAGFSSTPSDMVRLAAGYWNGFLDSAVVVDFWSRQFTRDGDPAIVGVGWRIGEDFAGRRIIHHSGADQGARTTLVLYPEERLAVATATNTVWVAAIEKNAQMLLAALRSPGGPSSLPAGAYRLTGTFSGDSAEAMLTLDGTTGTLLPSAPMRKWFDIMTVDTIPVVHVQDDLWAMVTPYGVADLRLRRDGGEAVWSETRTWRFTVTGETR